MHSFSLPDDLVERVAARTGKAHPFDVMDPAKTALVVIDMQNYFMKPGCSGRSAEGARHRARRVTGWRPRCARSAAMSCGSRTPPTTPALPGRCSNDNLMTPQNATAATSTMDTGARGPRAVAAARRAAGRRADRQEALQRLHPGLVRHRGASARARHRHAADRRHRHAVSAAKARRATP